MAFTVFVLYLEYWHTFMVEVPFGVSPRHGELGWKGSQQLNDVGDVI